MDFFEAVAKRHSYRGEFEDRQIPEEDIRKIMDAALRAPSGLNKQTTSFVLVTDPALRKSLAEIFPHKGISTAPLVVVAISVYMEIYGGKAFEIQDYSAAVENLLLAATALGYAAVWTDGESKDGNRQAEIAKLLNIPDEYTIQALIPVGVAKKAANQAAKKPLEERVYFNTFKQA